MAESERDRAGKEKIAAGMAEAGKGQVRGGGEAGRSGRATAPIRASWPRAWPRPGRVRRPGPALLRARPKKP